MASSTICGSLEKFNITSSSLLSFTEPSASAQDKHLPSVSVVTNEIVLDLYQFMCTHSECTYKSLFQWLSCLYGDKWPSSNPPSIKAITQSIKRLLAKMDKLKKLSNSTDKQQKISCLLNEQYSLPHVLIAGKLCKVDLSSDFQSDENYSADSSHNDEEIETLKAINQELTRELMQLKVTSELSKESSPDPNLKYLRERMYSLHRNTNKKLVRRDKAISEQAERLDKQKMELDKLQMKFTQMQSHVQQLKKDKDQLRHKANYWRTKTNQMKSSSEEREIETMVDKQQEIDVLRQDLQNIEDHNIELQDKLSELSTDEQIETFYKGRFTDDVRTCCYELLSLNVGIRNVELVIRSVMKHIVHQPIGRLPSHTVLCRMMLEGLSLSEIQLGEILSEEDMQNFTIQTDGTTKYGNHFATFDIATTDGSYTLGIRLVFSGSAQNTLETLKEILDDLDMVHKQMGQDKVSSKIISKLKNTMSDRHAAEKLFNELLAEYRADILPEVMANWSQVSESEREQLTRINNFFCGLHFLVGLADCAEAAIRLWEETHDLVSGKFSGTQRLIRTACKAFHARGSQQAGCSHHFRAFLRNRGIVKMPLAAFQGNRFNILFYDGAGVYFLREHMTQYLTTAHGSALNLLLQAVLADLKVPQYLAGCRALGIIDKLVTGPLWRYLQLASTSVLTMSEVYTTMKEKFEEWGEDAQRIVEGCANFLPQQESHDNVYKSLFMEAENDVIVQELLQIIFKSFAATVQRLLLDHLPGGIYYSVTDAMVEETLSVPTTNVNPERDFAMLDRLMSEKPNATHIALESLILFSHNQTSTWLQEKSHDEREKLLKAARSLSPLQKSRFLKRREEIRVKRQEAVKEKEKEYLKKKEKEIKMKEALTKRIQKFGLWTTKEEVEKGLHQLKSAKAKCDALKLQINFRRKVLEQFHDDKSVFLFSHQGKQHSHTQLFSNLLKLLPTEQQSLSIDQFLHHPELLVNKRIDHLFESDQGLQWFKGTVLEYIQDSKEYRVVYDLENDEYLFPLLEDLANGELHIFDN